MWLHVAHASSFSKPGSYHSINTAAGYPIILIRGKDSVIRAFHNVCRHRAYTVALKPSGTSLVMGCRYHGWSYDTRGKLIKAPKFDDVPGFDKEGNSLFEVKCFTDSNGIVFINLDSQSHHHERSAPEDSIEGFLSQRIAVIESWTVQALFNWKLLGGSSRLSGLDERAHFLRRTLRIARRTSHRSCYWQISATSTYATLANPLGSSADVLSLAHVFRSLR